jgi:hypothetical protein
MSRLSVELLLLALIGAKRMVVGHTVQRGGISPACAEQAWRIDVGLPGYTGESRRCWRSRETR